MRIKIKINKLYVLKSIQKRRKAIFMHKNLFYLFFIKFLLVLWFFKKVFWFLMKNNSMLHCYAVY